MIKLCVSFVEFDSAQCCHIVFVTRIWLSDSLSPSLCHGARTEVQRVKLKKMCTSFIHVCRIQILQNKCNDSVWSGAARSNCNELSCNRTAASTDARKHGRNYTNHDDTRQLMTLHVENSIKIHSTKKWWNNTYIYPFFDKISDYTFAHPSNRSNIHHEWLLLKWKMENAKGKKCESWIVTRNECGTHSPTK